MGLIASLIIHPTVGGNQGSIVTAAENATQTAIQDYLPYTINHSRPLYNDAVLRPAVKEILAGRFDKAYELLKPIVDGKDARMASKAAYNLAVVYEAQGDFDVAIDMAQLSIDKNQNGYASNLMQDLKSE
jgi:tetratricopeptide (TPR) repeat protein